MPRTKISKNSKRNRDAAKEDMLASRLKDFEATTDSFYATCELEYQQELKNILEKISIIRKRLPQKMLAMKMGELYKLNIKTFDEFNELEDSISADCVEPKSLNTTNQQRQRTQKKSKDDEGYLTEESGSSVNVTGMSSRPKPQNPPKGPLSSAKARARARRSKSASGYLTQTLLSSTKISGLEHSSRAKHRTPLTNRIKAFSADRAAPVTPKIAPNTPLSLLRYAKAGETVISLSGSPVVAQSGCETHANVNIPIENGIISLRPTQMQNIDPEFITRIDAETLNQIKQLQSNLNMIMSFADRRT